MRNLYDAEELAKRVNVLRREGKLVVVISPLVYRDAVDACDDDEDVSKIVPVVPLPGDDELGRRVVTSIPPDSPLFASVLSHLVAAKRAVAVAAAPAAAPNTFLQSWSDDIDCYTARAILGATIRTAVTVSAFVYQETPDGLAQENDGSMVRVERNDYYAARLTMTPGNVAVLDVRKPNELVPY